jgi:hypothetical protein
MTTSNTAAGAEILFFAILLLIKFFLTLRSDSTLLTF